MADGLSIPGVTDRYKTNDLVEALMETERVPLKREQEQLEKYQDQQAAWRDMNQKMSSLRESVKSLYSFENPFNNKLATSTEESAVTVEAGRNADFGVFKLDVLQPATADRFLSDNINKDMKVEAGIYTFSVGDKTVEFNWRGGKLNDFVTALNKRGNNIIKASLIGVTSKEKSLMIESLKTGKENRLVFKNAALDFAKEIKMISPSKENVISFPSSVDSFSSPSIQDTSSNLPVLSKNDVTSDGKTITIPSRNGIEIPIPENIRNAENPKIEFIFQTKETEDITKSLNNTAPKETLVLPSPGFIEYRGVTVLNEQSITALSLEDEQEENIQPIAPINDDSYIFVKNTDGSEVEIDSQSIFNDGNTTKISIYLTDYPDAESIVIRNNNTGKEFSLSVPEATCNSESTGFEPNHAITVADDAKFKYEGITLTRSTNDIDDVIPNVTLHLHDKTDKTAIINIDPDTESAKDALITFVGKYNQTVAEINILSSNKPEIISELDYLSDEEKAKEEKRLGMFQGDFSLSNSKTQMQNILSANYPYLDNADITMLNQIGISTNASGRTSGYNASQMRGYLEVDESKLDTQLQENLSQIKDLFGYDSDGDMIIDSGIGYLLDKHLTAWVQSGGIISTKTTSLDSKIKASNTKITKLETQLDSKEAELKRKYASMEGSLNSLESQQNSINNFTNSLNSNKNR